MDCIIVKFDLTLGGLHVKHAVHRGIWVPTQYLLWNGGKPRKPLIELAKTEILLYNIYKFSPYLTGNITSPLQSPTG
jgi:hypothetical protein